jgi:hypothetical protein
LSSQKQLLKTIKLEVEKTEAPVSAGELHAHDVWKLHIYPNLSF